MPKSPMSPISVNIKHAGKAYPLDVNTACPATTFKQSIYEATGVPVDRMKVMIKGMLKDDADMSKLGIKEGQSITVIGTAGPLPTGPAKQTVFLEDLSASQISQASGDPPGLKNLGQTCYLNSSLQVLKIMPELRQALIARPVATGSLENQLATCVQTLFTGMDHTNQPVAPFALLSCLRTLNPQFAEQSRSGGFAQQDADEAWTQLLSAIRTSLPSDTDNSFVDQLMSLELTKTLTCTENDQEAPTTSTEQTLKLECNISITTNFLVSGILDSLDQKIEKMSPTLNRTALYNQNSRLSRLPTYLTVHMVRFYWRRDIQKKAKIMRKVKFPLQLDTFDLMTDELRAKIQPVNTLARQILKDRDDRARAAKRDRKNDFSEAEISHRKEEKETVLQLARDNEVAEAGVNPTGIYELCGMITHKGASADSGHYMGWVRKDSSLAASGEEEWYKFDDDKVSTVAADKIQSMDGGGEDSTAYILLYRSAIMWL